ncbi:hypothetical protein E3P77_01316 [Wallemia ichthyophaga]|nr:hypothetical protein E3P84_01560 [Wallemia ichthyophaga]TIB41937.1 hypothetical protein E3P83_01509 [Wallemia ichthyophaga]TIB68132.1 hypothetical protein E3P77_01316 [Wallemia ichthyophaga]
MTGEWKGRESMVLELMRRNADTPQQQQQQQQKQRTQTTQHSQHAPQAQTNEEMIPRKKVLGLLQFLGPPVGCKMFQHVSELATLPGLDLESGMSRIAFMPIWLHLPADKEWDAEEICKTGLKLPQGGVGNKAPVLEDHLCKIGRPDIGIEHWYEMGDWVCSECRFLCWASKNECRECGASGNDPVNKSSVQTARPQQPPVRVALRNALCVEALDAFAKSETVMLISGGEKIETGTAASRRSPEADKKRIPITPAKVQSGVSAQMPQSAPLPMRSSSRSSTGSTGSGVGSNPASAHAQAHSNKAKAAPRLSTSPLPTSTSFDTTWMPTGSASNTFPENNGFLSRQRSRANNSRRNPPTPLLPIFASGWSQQDHNYNLSPAPLKSTGLLTPISSPISTTSDNFTLADLHADAQPVERRSSGSGSGIQPIGRPKAKTANPYQTNFTANLPSPPQSAESSPNKFDPFNNNENAVGKNITNKHTKDIPTSPSEQDVEDALFKASTALVEFCLN